MSERLVEELAGLNLATTLSPSKTSAPVYSYTVVLCNAPTPLVYELYRADMHPRDMSAAGLAAGNAILVGALLMPAWPNPTVPSKNIQLSAMAASILHTETGKIIAVSPWRDPIPRPSQIVFECKDANTELERELLLSGIRQLPFIQVGMEYKLPLGTRSEPVLAKILEACPHDLGSHFSACEKSTLLQQSRSSYGDYSALQKEGILIGGLESEMHRIIETIELSLKHETFLKKYKVKAPRGILLHGPSGTGKTLLAQVVAAQLKLKFFSLDSTKVFGQYYGESESRLRSIFDEASKASPAIVFIDEIDALCPQRDAATLGSDSRVVATLLTIMDGLRGGTGKLFILAATNRLNSVDNALRRPGRFDFEIEIGIPSRNQRQKILKALINHHNLTNISESCISKISEETHGFVGADLCLVIKEAILASLQGNHFLSLEDKDLYAALPKVKPSAIRDVLLEVPQVNWDQIGGQEDTKQKLKESIEWPLKYPEKFIAFGIKPPKGVLLYGPPGCSKTLLAKALATESGLNFLAVKGPELFSKWVGDSEKAVREIFRKARLASPSIIFFDEFDAIGAQRSLDDSSSSSVSDRVLSQLLSEMDGIDPLVNVTIIAATNRPDIIDSALLRPGRFDRHVYVALPDLAARQAILSINAKKMPFDPEFSPNHYAEKTEGYSGAELVAVCQEAALQALAENISSTCIKVEHFEKALEIVTPRISPESLQLFEQFASRDSC